MSKAKYLNSATRYYLTEGRRDGLPIPSYLKHLLPKRSKAVEAWRTLKALLIMERGYRCERCGAQRDIELWRKAGAKPGSADHADVELLCPACCP